MEYARDDEDFRQIKKQQDRKRSEEIKVVLDGISSDNPKFYEALLKNGETIVL